MEEKTIRELKIGEFFTLKEIAEPTEKQVYIRGEYDREAKRFDCGRFDDINFSRMFHGDRMVYTGFTF